MTSRDGQPALVELAGVDPDADVALEVAADGDLAHAGDRLQLLLDPVAGEVGEDLLREGAGEADHRIGLVLGVATWR